MTERFDIDALSVEVLEQVDRLCLDFEDAWRAGRSPSLETQLDGLSSDCYRAALCYLVALERELLRKEGNEPSLQSYRERFPKHQQIVELAWGEPSGFQVLLEAIVGPHCGRRFTFRHHDSFIVGRAECAHFQLPVKDPFFSRVHFLIEANPPRCRLVDLCSLNGTKVNGQRIDWIDLQEGDLIQGGDTVMRVSIRTPQRDTPRPWKSSAASISQTQMHDALPHLPGYELLSELGRGGMGAVYRAKCLANDVLVAIKVIRSACIPSDSEVRRFLREAQILCSLRHPNIVSFHQFGRVNDLFYFIMDLVPGLDASQMVKQRGPLEINRALRIIGEALDALQYAHEKGYVHRDVKPSNLLISGDESREVCRLADFGLARVYYTTRMSGLTLMGDIGGTLPFMAPEQITDFRNAKPTADQYGMAATLYYMCTQQYIYADQLMSDGRQIAKSVLLGDPVFIQERRVDIPRSLAQAIHKALAKSPQDRYANAAEFRDALFASAHG